MRVNRTRLRWIRLTNMISAGGGLAQAWVQITGLTEDEMPSAKTPSGIIIIKVRGLSADGALNADSQSYGYIVLIRKGAGIETEMFRLYDEIVAIPSILMLRKKIGIDDKHGSIPSYGQAVLSSDGGPTQLKALQNIDGLRQKCKLSIVQMKLAKNASLTTQACDAGDLHKRQCHHAKTLTTDMTPTQGLINPLGETIQGLRDSGQLKVNAKWVTHVLNMAIRLPTVLLKSSDPKSNIRSFYIPGIVDKGQQGPDVDVMMASYKKKMTIDLKKKCLEQIPGLLKDQRRLGRILEEVYETLGHPGDTSSDGVEHPLSSAFVTQHHRQ